MQLSVPCQQCWITKCRWPTFEYKKIHRLMMWWFSSVLLSILLYSLYWLDNCPCGYRVCLSYVVFCFKTNFNFLANKDSSLGCRAIKMAFSWQDLTDLCQYYSLSISSKRGNINTAALVTIAQCNTLVVLCSRQLIGPADWAFVTLGPLHCN